MTSGSRFTKSMVTYTRNANLTIRCRTTLLILVRTPGGESDVVPDTSRLATKQQYRQRLTFVWYWGTHGAACGIQSCGIGEHVVQLVASSLVLACSLPVYTRLAGHRYIQIAQISCC